MSNIAVHVYLALQLLQANFFTNEISKIKFREWQANCEKYMKITSFKSL